MKNLIEQLNAPQKHERLEALRQIKAKIDSGEIKAPISQGDVNNHIHSTYSFSPYSPTKALYAAYMAGLQTAGIMDHDSISGAEEFIEAGKIMEMATTIGFELRVKFENTPFADKRINNPDQLGNVYTTTHGVPHTQIKKCEEFLKPVCEARGRRNRKIVKNINALMNPFGIEVDYDKDVLPLSLAHIGGSVTERHLLFALSHKLIERFGKGKELVDFLVETLKIPISKKIADMLCDKDNQFYDYDLLGALKAELVEKIYVKADEECVDVNKWIEFVKEIGAISCAAYLGDIGDSITGDKKTQQFEDSYIDELFEYYKQLGFEGCAYMPSRNSAEQINKIKMLADKHQLIQISGEDINQPRQSFICLAARAKEFDCLKDTTWALIGHELAATIDLADSIVGEKAKALYATVDERVAAYKLR